MNNHTTSKIQSVIENTFVATINRLMQSDTERLMNDLSIQVDKESGELQIYDDTETLLGKVVIFSWANNKEPEGVFLKKVSPTLKAVLTVLSVKKAFDKNIFLKPFSVNLVDDEFAVIEELLFLDDEIYRLDDSLLKDLDSELDKFINDLLAD